MKYDFKGENEEIYSNNPPFICLITLCGCSQRNNSADSIEARNVCNFKKVYADVDVGLRKTDDIFVDTTTGVLYLRTWGDGFSGITPLYNTDGSLKIWKSEYDK